MRIANEQALKALKESAGGMSSSIARQLEDALNDKSFQSSQSVAGEKSQSRSARKPRVSGESKGEASVRLALLDAFGDWFNGGEVVQEVIPFPDRRYRVDFALVRYRAYIEVDGFSHHSKFLEDHHKDRLRGLHFSANGWLPFRVSHGQATQNPGVLVDSLREMMAHREPLPRSAIELEPVQHKHGRWYRLSFSL